ncbi:MAG: hypothetical protein AB8F78_01035 [Saprospiraceae bacterium]
MKASRIAILLALSVSCLTASYFILPRVQVNEDAGTRQQSSKAVMFDTLALPTVNGDTYERIILKREVRPGDTLGYVLRDRFRGVRDSLSAFAKTSILPSNLGKLSKAHVEELKKMARPVAETTHAPATKSRYKIRGVEREYLNSDIMGAEDASTEILGKLSHLTDAGKSETPEFRMLSSKLKVKQAFISAAKRRLAKKESVSSGKSAKPLTRPSLTSEQRDRILALSAELPLDTQRVYAPIAGRYYRPDDGVGFIIASTTISDGTQNVMESDQQGYTLKSSGQPALWGTAQRSDSSFQSNDASGKELKVSVQ